MDIKYMISADFGQTHDFTAVGVTERMLVPVGEPCHYSYTRGGEDTEARRILEARQDVEQHYHLMRLERVPLRTPYTIIAGGIVKLLQEFYKQHTNSQDHRGGKVTVGLAIDEGGVGKAVKDILRKEIEEGIERGKPHVHFLPVTVHGGANTTTGNGWVHVPKRDLISAGLVAFQNQRLKIGRLRWRKTLEEELANYRLKQNIATGYTAFEPLREGQHDDLLFTVCLGCWAWEQGTKKQKYITLPAPLSEAS
jgi:hypothetical protein